MVLGWKSDEHVPPPPDTEQPSSSTLSRSGERPSASAPLESDEQSSSTLSRSGERPSASARLESDEPSSLTLSRSGERPSASARLESDEHVPPQTWNEPAVMERRGPRMYVETPECVWFNSLPQRKFTDLLHDILDTELNRYFQTDEARKKLSKSKLVSLPWETVCQCIQDSSHPWCVSLAPFPDNRKLVVIERLRSKVKWICQQFVEKRSRHDPSEFSSWCEKNEHHGLLLEKHTKHA